MGKTVNVTSSVIEQLFPRAANEPFKDYLERVRNCNFTWSHPKHPGRPITAQDVCDYTVRLLAAVTVFPPKTIHATDLDAADSSPEQVWCDVARQIQTANDLVISRLEAMHVLWPEATCNAAITSGVDRPGPVGKPSSLKHPKKPTLVSFQRVVDFERVAAVLAVPLSADDLETLAPYQKAIADAGSLASVDSGTAPTSCSYRLAVALALQAERPAWVDADARPDPACLGGQAYSLASGTVPTVTFTTADELPVGRVLLNSGYHMVVPPIQLPGEILMVAKLVDVRLPDGSDGGVDPDTRLRIVVPHLTAYDAGDSGMFTVGLTVVRPLPAGTSIVVQLFPMYAPIIKQDLVTVPAKTFKPTEIKDRRVAYNPNTHMCVNKLRLQPPSAEYTVPGATTGNYQDLVCPLTGGDPLVIRQTAAAFFGRRRDISTASAWAGPGLYLPYSIEQSKRADRSSAQLIPGVQVGFASNYKKSSPNQHLLSLLAGRMSVKAANKRTYVQFTVDHAPTLGPVQLARSRMVSGANYHVRGFRNTNESMRALQVACRYLSEHAGRLIMRGYTPPPPKSTNQTFREFLGEQLRRKAIPEDQHDAYVDDAMMRDLFTFDSKCRALPLDKAPAIVQDVEKMRAAREAYVAGLREDSVVSYSQVINQSCASLFTNEALLDHLTYRLKEARYNRQRAPAKTDDATTKRDPSPDDEEGAAAAAAAAETVAAVAEIVAAAEETVAAVAELVAPVAETVAAAAELVAPAALVAEKRERSSDDDDGAVDVKKAKVDGIPFGDDWHESPPDTQPTMLYLPTPQDSQQPQQQPQQQQQQQQ